MHILKRLTLTAAVLASVAGASLAYAVDFYHDKANWQDAFMSVLGKAPAAVTATPLPVSSR